MIERDIQTAILDAIGAAPETLAERMNTGAIKIGGRFVRFGVRGAPDIRVCVQGRAVAVEVKAPRGVQSPAQLRWQRAFEGAGGIYVLARDVPAVLDVLIAISTGAPRDYLTRARNDCE